MDRLQRHYPEGGKGRCRRYHYARFRSGRRCGGRHDSNGQSCKKTGHCMRENLVQRPVKGTDGRSYIANDWFPHGIPSNVALAANVYMDTSYGFAGFHSEEPEGLVMEEGSGLYEIVTFNLSPRGKIRVGKFSIVNGATLICNNSISIGDHCMIAWGATLTDSWLDASASSLAVRQEVLYQSATNPC